MYFDPLVYFVIEGITPVILQVVTSGESSIELNVNVATSDGTARGIPQG